MVKHTSFEEFLDKEAVSPRTKREYLNVIEKFRTTNPDITSPEAYHSFLVETAFNKRCYLNKYAVLKYLEWIKLPAPNKKKIIKMIRKMPIKVLDREKTSLNLGRNQLIDIAFKIDNERYAVVALLQCFLGLRFADAIKIKLGNIMFEELIDHHEYKTARITLIGKGNKAQTHIIYNKKLVEILLRYLLDHTVYTIPPRDDIGFEEWEKLHAENKKEFDLKEYPFLAKLGYKVKGELDFDNLVRRQYVYYRDTVKEAVAKCGHDPSKFSTHDFRRCFAHRVWEQFKDLDALQRLMHHASPATSLRYLRQSGQDLAEKAQAIQN